MSTLTIVVPAHKRLGIPFKVKSWQIPEDVAEGSFTVGSAVYRTVGPDAKRELMRTLLWLKAGSPSD